MLLQFFLMHSHLGHISGARFQRTAWCSTDGVGLSTFFHIPPIFLRARFYGKQYRQPFPCVSLASFSWGSWLIHTDICGLSHPPIHTAFRYFLIFVDKIFTCLHHLFVNAEVKCLSALLSICDQCWNSTLIMLSISNFCIDNGGEYKSSLFEFVLFVLLEILAISYVPNSPSQNGAMQCLKILVSSSRIIQQNNTGCTFFLHVTQAVTELTLVSWIWD